ncbi:MAG: HAD family phosphatase [Myxococcales bacterium]|nr:HAD family phosphatase [Myxococcales bacterium]
MMSEQPQTTAVFFDLGGVLVDLRLDLMRAAWERLSGITSTHLDRFLFDLGHKTAMDTGKSTPDEVVLALNHHFGLRLTLTEFAGFWNQTLIPRGETNRFVSKVAQQFPTFLLSNTDPVHHAYVTENLSCLSHFRSHVLSYSVGVEKPNAPIYAAAENRAGLNPESLIFIDDLAPNVAAARSRGWNGLLYTDLPSMIRGLADLGVVVHE